MSLIGQIQSGASFVRTTVTLPVGSGSTTAFGSSYILLDITSAGQGRTRLYSDSASVQIDNLRTTASFNLSASVGLSLDTYIDTASKIIFDPPIVATTFSGSTTFYNVSGSGVTITFYPIESQYAVRQGLTVYASSLPVGTSLQGNLSSPKSFIILSGSSTTSESRLRLYSRDINTIPSTELTRTYGGIVGDDASLIVDMLFDSASYAYKLSPVLQAYNLTNYSSPENLVGYRIENMSSISTISNVTMSIYIYPIES